MVNLANILLVCSGNTCRSPMAQALFRRKLIKINSRTNYQIESAGLQAGDGQPASPEAVEVMREQGIDISSHRSTSLKEIHMQNADLILTMTASHRDYIHRIWPEKLLTTYTICEFAGDPSREVLDPYGLGLEAYRACCAQLKILIDELFDKIIESKMR